MIAWYDINRDNTSDIAWQNRVNSTTSREPKMPSGEPQQPDKLPTVVKFLILIDIVVAVCYLILG